ncbi:MAG: CDP-alcohol phosphatidyltransferase family protein, partial [Terriglobus roseus]|nr:CDP-alcohol phosphatidyltransferase family protein [Terriglobus roseus]
MLQVVPWSLVFLRLALAPGIVWAAAAQFDSRILSACVLVALLSDIYDGVIARRLGCDTAAIRVADSLVDTVFYLGVLVALWIRKPEVVRHEWPLLAILLMLEGVRYVVDLRKFGRSASYHSYLAKAWGLVMAIALILVFASSAGGLLLAAALVLGIL